MSSVSETSKYKNLIILVSILIPIAVAILYFTPSLNTGDLDLSFLPKVNATINGTTSLLLIAALLAIKRNNIQLHKRLMVSALGLSVLFLLSYVLYHSTHESTPYGGEGVIRSIYFFILITHIVLAAVIVPLVLISFVRALEEKFDKHKKIARITFPLWLYVSVTGVVIYWMISPFYN
jgi:putative membrane protein